jgi:3-dehydroquinate dehydratase II
MKILIIHGPNLNLLGTREPDIYGTMTLDKINSLLHEKSEAEKADISVMQSNHEGVIIDAIHGARGVYDGILINPAGFGHTSVAILDAFKAVNIPSVEVHLSNIYAREEFRRHTVTGSAMIGVVSGFGYYSYIIGFQALCNHLRQNKK